jgi:hypothetical protein
MPPKYFHSGAVPGSSISKRICALYGCFVTVPYGFNNARITTGTKSRMRTVSVDEVGAVGSAPVDRVCRASGFDGHSSKILDYRSLALCASCRQPPYWNRSATTASVLVVSFDCR